MRWLALIFATGLWSCSEEQRELKAPVAPAAHSIDAAGSPVQGAPEPEVVRLTKVDTVDGKMRVTVGNVAGDYVLSCSLDANKDHGPRSCVAPSPQRDYLLFRKNAKWLINGAEEPMNLNFMQNWSVTYNSGENIGLLPAKKADEQAFGVYVLVSWTARSSPS